MGGGSYSYINAHSRATKDYSSKSKETIFKQHDLDPSMDPRNFTVRESCDSKEHPESFPIIIALDETGSMGRIPYHIITKLLPNIIKKLMDLGIDNPQVCFMGIGDAQYLQEDAPIQVGQFESSDTLMEHWLKHIYLEGRGGGNRGENYSLAWYIAAYKTKIDSYNKRHKKGVLITIGDEPVHTSIDMRAITKYIGNNEYDRDLVDTTTFLKDAQKKWDVYHIHVDGSGTYKLEDTNWPDILPNDKIKISYNKDADDIADILPAIIYNSYKHSNATKTEDSLFDGVEVGE